MKKTILNTSKFTWGEACEGFWFKKEGAFTVILEIMPPSTSEVKHFHKVTEQFFFVLAGELLVEMNDTLYTLQKHEGLTVSANAPHQVFNLSHQPVHFVVISCPNSHNDRIDLP